MERKHTNHSNFGNDRISEGVRGLRWREVEEMLVQVWGTWEPLGSQEGGQSTHQKQVPVSNT